MELFQIKINNQGEIESEKIIQKINSLNEAKIFDELQSNKTIGRVETQTSQQPLHNFKKNRNYSTTSQNAPVIVGNINPNSVGYNSTNGSNPLGNNMMNNQNSNKIANQVYLADSQKNYMKDVRITEQHRLVLEGVKLAIEII